MEQRIFITGTMRTGSSLVSNALSVHSKILILSDRVHFFRFIYKRYDPLNENNIHKMLLHQKARLYYRFGVNLDVNTILKNIKGRKFTYSVIYDEIMKYYLRRTDKEIWGDDPALQWREIPLFLKLFPYGKVIHFFRDPRAVLVSWKKSSGLPNNGYLNSLFNSIDSLKFVKKLSDSLSAESYFPLKYEDLVSNPEKWIKKLCEFLNIDFEKAMLQPEKWESILKETPVELGKSSFDGTVVGFSPKRANRWKEVIENWELCLVESLAGTLLIDHGYNLTKKKFSASDFALALEKIKQNDFLLKQLYKYLVRNEGTNKYPTEPTDYRNWGAPNDPSKWFKDTPQAKEYLKEVKKINEKFGD